MDDIRFLSDARYMFSPARMEIKTTVIKTGSPDEEKTAIDYIYSINEMETMFLNAGLRFAENYSIPGKKKFAIGDPRAYLIAIKD